MSTPLHVQFIIAIDFMSSVLLDYLHSYCIFDHDNTVMGLIRLVNTGDKYTGAKHCNQYKSILIYLSLRYQISV